MKHFLWRPDEAVPGSRKVPASGHMRESLHGSLWALTVDMQGHRQLYTSPLVGRVVWHLRTSGLALLRLGLGNCHPVFIAHQVLSTQCCERLDNSLDYSNQRKTPEETEYSWWFPS